ncbi:MAG: hypothetical protein DMG06_15040 [Acidobacteria bacterium]|nr:MAG: hypothetical protein DMG06_15040 [Acidobacteriota bacterium]
MKCRGEPVKNSNKVASDILVVAYDLHKTTESEESSRAETRRRKRRKPRIEVRESRIEAVFDRAIFDPLFSILDWFRALPLWLTAFFR